MTATLRTRLFAVLLVCLLLALREFWLLPDGHVHLSFLDVGQGDSILIVSPRGHQILIDGGPDLSTLEELGSHLPFFDRTIDLLVLTHPHLDHLASFPEILRRYQVKSVLLNGTVYSLPRYRELLQQISDQRIAVVRPDTQGRISFGDGLGLQRLWPAREFFGKTFKNVHDASIVLRAVYGTHSALLVGDLEERGEVEILQRGIDVHSDILKVGHHGSLTSSSSGFLVAVHPQLAVISAGKGNSYGLPKQAILDRLAHFGIPVKRTDRDGTVEVTWR